MKRNILEADETAVNEKYHTGKLLGRLIAVSDLSDEQTASLLSCDSTLHTSSCECVRRCCDRIIQARNNHEKVFVGGDYDADGISATAIMKRTLDVLGIQNGYYIPDRFKEGYGLSPATVSMVKEKGYSLIITVDNGVKAHEALAKARELGLEVIVTDHHRIEEDIDADIVVHPDYMEPEYEYLCGAGVALEISRNLIGNRDELTAIAAVASIGDVMPLWKETRRIVLAGMEILRRRIPRSLDAMLRPGTPVSWTSIAFQIVPKLNSVGRMNDISNVNTLVPYLLSTDERVISTYAVQLDHVNEVRRELSEAQTKTAEKMVDDSDILLLYNESFHEGICGLIAGRIANSLQKPVLVFAKSGSLIKGSGRSVSGFDMFSFFSDFDEPCAFGGHEQAVGISVNAEDFERFCAHVKTKFAAENYTYEEPSLTAVSVKADEITMDEIMALSRAEPVPKELISNFALTDPVVLSVKETPKVTRYTLACASGPLEAVLFKRKGIVPPEEPSCMIGKLTLNRWRSNVTMTLEIEDIF
ncbi:MAG: DHH family phosphoesterase [Solobacterium sp.]|nr:DHH family phosphoesterase [Solobacterium sp.]